MKNTKVNLEFFLESEISKQQQKNVLGKGTPTLTSPPRGGNGTLTLTEGGSTPSTTSSSGTGIPEGGIIIVPLEVKP